VPVRASSLPVDALLKEGTSESLRGRARAWPRTARVEGALAGGAPSACPRARPGAARREADSGRRRGAAGSRGGKAVDLRGAPRESIAVGSGAWGSSLGEERKHWGRTARRGGCPRRRQWPAAGTAGLKFDFWNAQFSKTLNFTWWMNRRTRHLKADLHIRTTHNPHLIRQKPEPCLVHKIAGSDAAREHRRTGRLCATHQRTLSEGRSSFPR